MLERAGEHPAHAYHPDGRCCTYHPSLPNFIAGRALARGGSSAASIERRLAEPSGVSSWGIKPTASWAARHRVAGHEDFGRDVGLQCPYWAGGEFACAIWRDRNGVCRTFFCKHDAGLPGAMAWDALCTALARAEDAVARACVARGEPPDGDGATPERWAAWYRECDVIAGDLRGDELAAVATPELDKARTLLVARSARLDDPMPEVLVPSVGYVDTFSDGRVRLAGYSSYDAIVGSTALYELLAVLDGYRTWPEAIGLVEGIDEATIRELYRVNAIEPPEANRKPDPRSLPMWKEP